MTRAEILATVARRLNKASPLPTETSTRLVEFLNETHREILSAPGRERLRRKTFTFASVDGQAFYGLASVSHVHRIWDTSNDRVLIPTTLAEYRRRFPDPASVEGTPDQWAVYGFSDVAKQPSTPDELYVKASAAGTGTAYVEGEITGGYPKITSASYNGTTGVALTGGADFRFVSRFYLGAAASVDVTLHEGSGSGTELGRIYAGQTRQPHLGIYLIPTPSAAVTYTVDAVFEIADLAQDTAEPLLPREFHDLIVLGVMKKEYEKTDDDRYEIKAREYQARVAQLDYALHRPATEMPSRDPRVGLSRLGGWFPAGY